MVCWHLHSTCQCLCTTVCTQQLAQTAPTVHAAGAATFQATEMLGRRCFTSDNLSRARQVLVEREGGDKVEKMMSVMQPGDTLSVSQPLGRGCAEASWLPLQHMRVYFRQHPMCDSCTQSIHSVLTGSGIPLHGAPSALQLAALERR